MIAVLFFAGAAFMIAVIGSFIVRFLGDLWRILTNKDRFYESEYYKERMRRRGGHT